jgi:uncharacterized protein YciI
MVHHFIVELTYRVPFDDLAETLPDHRKYLQTAYDQGFLLFSGPQLPKIGGIIVARMPSLDDVRRFFAEDPFQKKGLADYRYIEFDMVKRQGFMDHWSNGE